MERYEWTSERREYRDARVVNNILGTIAYVSTLLEEHPKISPIIAINCGVLPSPRLLLKLLTF